MNNVSLILTVLNEEQSILRLLESVQQQSRMPSEIIIVDGGSTDKTEEIVREYSTRHPDMKIHFSKTLGNRAIGRNAAVAQAHYDSIAVTDAGCILDPSWLQKITEPFDRSEPADFVGGWYQSRITNDWDQSLAIVLGFSANRVNAKSFLPSTRSMAFQKTLWSKVGGFDESNSHSEDTPFALAMKKSSQRFVFVPDAVVHWSVVQSNLALFQTISRYALGDGEQRLWMSQYRWLTLGMLVEIVFILAAKIFSPVFWLFGATCLLVYIYLPLLTTRYPRPRQGLYQVPLMKMILIAANLSGFYRGLLRSRIARRTSNLHARQP